MDRINRFLEDVTAPVMAVVLGLSAFHLLFLVAEMVSLLLERQ
jgi:hypothetical protein